MSAFELKKYLNSFVSSSGLHWLSIVHSMSEGYKWKTA